MREERERGERIKGVREIDNARERERGRGKLVGEGAVNKIERKKR